MCSDSLIMILVCILINYAMLIPVFYLILIERSKTIDYIIAARNPRKRMGLAKTRKTLKKDVVTAIVWPLLLIRELTYASRKKK